MRFLVTLTLCLALGSAEPLAAQPEKSYPLRAVHVVGNKVVPTEKIVAATELEIGQPVTEREFRDALQRLNNSGLFELIEFAFGPFNGGYQVTFQVSEVEQLYDVKFRGFEQSEEELHALVNDAVPMYIRQSPGDGIMVIRIGNTVQEAWKKAGNDSKIVGQLVPGDGEELVMLFRPKEATQAIAFVTFEGSGVIPPLELQRIFNPVAMGESYSETRLLELLRFNIRPFYEELGRMNVKFCPCSSEPDPNTEGVLAKVAVDEGPLYKWGEIQRPSPAPFDERGMARIFTIETGDPVNIKEAREIQTKMDEGLRRIGFLKSDTTVDINVDHEEKLVALTYNVDPGERYTFRRLEIKGLDILSEPVIRKRWGLDLGDWYNTDYPVVFLNRIRQDQMFDNLEDTRHRVSIDETNKAVDVTIEFIGKKDKTKYLPDYKPDQDPFPFR